MQIASQPLTVTLYPALLHVSKHSAPSVNWFKKKKILRRKTTRRTDLFK